MIEAVISVTFLATKPHFLARWRDWALIGFIGATYAIVPVMGFGYTLVILGFVSCPRERIYARGAYLIVLGVLELSRLPWDRLIT